MSGFDDFAGKLSKQHVDRTQEYQERVVKENAERDEQHRRDIAKLETEAMPVLSEAKSAFERQGLRVTVKKNWEPHAYMQPSVEFQLWGQKDRAPHSHGTYEVEGDKVIVKVENEKLRSDIWRRLLSEKRKEEFTSYGTDGLEHLIKDIAQCLYDYLAPDAR